MDISAELSEISSYGGFFAVTVGGEAAGWHPVTRSYASGYTDLIDATVARYRTSERRVAASLVQLAHAARLWSPVLACALAHGVIPDLTRLQRAADGARLRLPEPVGDPVDRDSSLPDALYRVVVREHMEPFADGLRVKVAPDLLAGNIASALVGTAQALVAVRPDLGEPIVAVTGSLLGTGALAGTMTGSGLGWRRRSCCLLYRTPVGTKCGDCGL